jgi:hypothetical protein
VLYGEGIFGIALFLLWIYCIFDVISTEESLTRNMPKFVWLMIVIFLPDIGSVAWLLLGRPQNAGFTPGDTSYRPPRAAPRGPEDSPGFIAGLDDRARDLKRWEDDLRRREEELRKKDEGG